MNIPTLGTHIRAKLDQRFWSKVAIANPTECWEWQASTAWNGYGRFNLSGYDNERAHRVALALSLNREISSSEWVLHRCDNPRCCNPAHLYLGDRHQNAKDAVSRDRVSRHATGNTWTVGSRNGCAKLDEDKVAAIKLALRQGESQSSVAARFAVAQSNVSLISRGLRWRHVP